MAHKHVDGQVLLEGILPRPIAMIHRGPCQLGGIPRSASGLAVFRSWRAETGGVVGEGRKEKRKNTVGSSGTPGSVAGLPTHSVKKSLFLECSPPHRRVRNFGKFLSELLISNA